MYVTYPYRRDSGLPRRSFVVNVSLLVAQARREYLAIEVTAPDALSAEGVVRKLLNSFDHVTAYSFDLVREIDMCWNTESGRYDAPLVRVPVTFEGRLSITGSVISTTPVTYR